MTDVIVAVPMEIMKQLREKVNGTKPEDLEDQAIVLWVIENYLDEAL